MPPRWALGYLQSHRTLDGPDADRRHRAHDAREEAAVRRAHLPRHRVRAVGMEHAQRRVHLASRELPRARKQLDALHDEHFKVVLHVVIEGQASHRRRDRSVHRAAAAERPHAGQQVAARSPGVVLLAVSQTVMDVGVDGWWPDQGDGFDGPSELNRHRMYWEGTQLYRPNERPFALHRNASAGVQRFGGFIWSGDVQSRWETLKTHVPVAINTGLSGFPYWGTDIGGFYSDRGIHRRAVRTLVPVRRVLSAVSIARPQLASALAVGLGRRRRRSARNAATSRPIRPSCTTRRSSRSAASISSCVIG